MFAQRAIDPTPATRYRSDRVTLVNGQFFFSTREGTLEGPYFKRSDAERDIGAYVQRMIQARELLDSRTF